MVRTESRYGVVVRAFASRQCGPVSILAWCHLCVVFVAGSRPCSEDFTSVTPAFLPAAKTNNQPDL